MIERKITNQGNQMPGFLIKNYKWHGMRPMFIGLSLLISLLIIGAQSMTLFAQTYTAPDYKDPLIYSANPPLNPYTLLRSPISARAAGMSASMADVSDIGMALSNPAMLSYMNYWQMQLGHRDEVAKVDANSLATNIPFAKSSLVIYGVYAHVYDYENTYYNLPANPYKRYRAGYAGLGYGHRFWMDRVSAGLNVKWMSGHTSTQFNGLFLDAGLLVKYDLSQLRHTWSFFYYLPEMTFSYVARNIHPRFAKSEEASSGTTPQEPSKEFAERTDSQDFGIALTYHRTFSLLVDFHQPYQFGKNSFSAGIEMWPIYFVSLRAGITTPYYEDKKYTLTAGIGMGERFGLTDNRLSIEYAFQADMVDRTQIERRHQFTLTTAFGGWRYTEKYADDSPVQLTKLINDTNNFQIADQKPQQTTPGKQQSTGYGWDNSVVQADQTNVAVTTPPARKWQLTVFKYRGQSGYEKGGEFLADRITKSVIATSLQTNMVELIPSWKQEKIAPMLKRQWGESDEVYLHRLGTTLGTDYILLGVVDMRGDGYMIQSQLFEVQRKKFVLNYRSTGTQIEIEDGIRKHLNGFQAAFIKVVRKKTSSIPTKM